MFAVITTFGNQHWEVYAKESIKSFVKYWPKEVPLLIQLDDDLLADQVGRLIRPQDAIACGREKDHADFIARNQSKDDPANYRKQTVRFCHKVFAIKRALEAIKAQKATGGETPRYLIWLDGDYRICYGILRHRSFDGDGNWFEVDKGFWGANHYTGMYRLSFKGTQPRYSPDAPRMPHGLDFEPWRDQAGPNLIAPPTAHVCEFFGVDYTSWLTEAMRHGPYIIRHKGDQSPIPWDSISKVITFNSTLGIEALRRGIPVISDENHSLIGSYTKYKKALANYERSELYEVAAGSMFKLSEKEKICRIIKHHLSNDTAYS